ncbi:MAG: efflux RND transporter periplasmic adaptor subunit [Gammaproteobacteria bacterium HGW-Gammaproteobacteria-3]|nr:MAG: efflux RND transporter periplasmic adaptor subunit [Gammaproteobacteria bacterium HGW-Gammaproteobacteria-3]
MNRDNSLRKKGSFLISCLAILIVAGGLSGYWLNHQPRAARKPIEPTIPLVETIEPLVTDFHPRIQAFGTVMAAHSVSLNARVQGIVVSTSENYIEGGLVKQNEEIVRLDPTDYELALEQAQSELARAQFNLKLELGQQAVAKLEYEMLGQGLDQLGTELVQRKPHLEASKAALRSAQAAYQQAKLNLQRTHVIAPFDAAIIERNSEIGTKISTAASGDPLVKLVATESFWIDVSLPVEKLRWIDIPGFNGENASTVKIEFENGWKPNEYRIGRVKKLKVAVEPEGRMAKLIVEVDDPLSLKPGNRHKPALMLNTLVRVEITGKPLQRVVQLPETALHDGREIWLMNDSQTLDIAKVTPRWIGQGSFYLDAEQLPSNSRVVASNLPTPVPGMRIRKLGDISEPVMTSHADEAGDTYAD